jgi:adenylate kinase
MDVDFDVLMQRLTGRRTCENCGAAYNIYTNPPRFDEQCDRCGSTLHHRADDNEETIGNRLRVYESQTKPLINFYRQQGRLETVDAVGEVSAIFKRLLPILEPIAKGIRKPVLPPPAPVKPGKAKAADKKAAIKPAAKPGANKSSKQGVGKQPAAKKPAAKAPVKKDVAKKTKAVTSKPKKTAGKSKLVKSKASGKKTAKPKTTKSKSSKPKKSAAGKKKSGRK